MAQRTTISQGRRGGKQKLHPISPSSRASASAGNGSAVPKVGSMARLIRGPTKYSNWMSPYDRNIIAGAYPGSMDDRYHLRHLSRLLQAGVTTFVCLQAEFDPQSTEREWRSCQKLRPYVADALGLVMTYPGQFPQTKGQLQLLHFPIPDMGVVADDHFVALIHDLMARLARGEVLYVHCWGGHGRTGTVVAVLIGLLYGFSVKDALERTQEYHDYRLEAKLYGRKIESPQNAPQRNQVKRVLPQLCSMYLPPPLAPPLPHAASLPSAAPFSPAAPWSPSLASTNGGAGAAAAAGSAGIGTGTGTGASIGDIGDIDEEGNDCAQKKTITFLNTPPSKPSTPSSLSTPPHSSLRPPPCIVRAHAGGALSHAQVHAQSQLRGSGAGAGSWASPSPPKNPREKPLFTKSLSVPWRNSRDFGLGASVSVNTTLSTTLTRAVVVTQRRQQ